MYRRYSISIEVNDTADVDLKSLEKVLGCSVSDPSNWVEYGSTTAKGLTFLNKDGRELASSVFLHQPYFTTSENTDKSEINEIRSFVFAALARHYSITPDDVSIKVSEYNRL